MAAHRIELDDLLGLRQLAGSLDLSSRRRVMTDWAGSHLSGFRGRGMSFEEHRRYVAGDDVRTIDWRVTARTGQTHVRSYREERERPVLFAVDLRAPMWFGSRRCFKAVLAARAAAALAWAADRNGDRIGGLCFDARAHECRPAGGRRGALRLFRQLSLAPDLGSALPLRAAVDELRRIARPGSLIVLLSDLHDLNEDSHQGLQLLARHCELVIGMLSDPLEREAPVAGLYPGRVEEQGQAGWLNTAHQPLRDAWTQQFQDRETRARNAAMSCRAHWLSLDTASALESALQHAFGRRTR